MVFNIISSDKKALTAAKELGEFCGFSVGEEGVKVIVKKADNDLRIEFNKNDICLYYSTLPEFCLGVSYCVQFFGKENYVLKRSKNFPIGLMKCCTQNAKPKIQTVKDLIKVIALLGYDYLILSVEDMFEISGLDYLGSFKAKFDNKEIQEIDEYAKLFGIEVIAGIQTLCPMSGTRSRDAFVGIMGNTDTLFVGEDKTYQFIERLIKFCSEAFSSKKIHLGMEICENIRAGAYFNKFGYSSYADIFSEHIDNVIKIALKYSFSPFVWADNLFYCYLGINAKNGYLNIDKKTFSEDLNKKFSDKVKWVLRAYPKFKDSAFMSATETLKNLTDDFCFASDAYTGIGFSPLNTLGQQVADKIMQLNQSVGEKSFTLVLSDENGSECSVFSALATCLFASEKAYGNDINLNYLNDRAKSLFGLSFSELNMLELPNVTPNNEQNSVVNPSKYLFYNDPLLGIFDAHTYPKLENVYHNHYENIKKINIQKTKFRYLFDVAAELCAFLEKKSVLGLKITNFYLKNDRKALKKIAEKTIPTLILSLDRFYKVFKYAWEKENHTTGFEITDVRIGGVKERLLRTSERINAFLSGKTDKIEELEQPRLPYSKSDKSGRDVFYNIYRNIASSSDI